MTKEEIIELLHFIQDQADTINEVKEKNKHDDKAQLFCAGGLFFLDRVFIKLNSILDRYDYWEEAIMIWMRKH